MSAPGVIVAGLFQGLAIQAVLRLAENHRLGALAHLNAARNIHISIL
jgi:hypothetical protein